MTGTAERVELSPRRRIAEILKLGEKRDVWIKKIEPLSKKEFPDGIEVNQFLIMFTPRSLRSQFEEKLDNAWLREDQKHEVFQALCDLSEPCVYGIRLVENGKYLTLGQIRKLTESDLMKLDGLSDPISSRRKIICRLFGLKNIAF